MKTLFLKFSFIVLLAIICSGCALNYRLDQPVPSDYKYDSGDNTPTVLQIVDQRTDNNFFKGTGGLSRVNIKLENVDDPIDWLARALQKEFAARGTAVQIVSKDHQGDPNLVLSVQNYQIINYRVSGFTPWVAYHSFKGELTSGGQTYPIHAYFLYGKVPVWSMSEIHEPCLNMPMTILVKEIASKINRYSLNYSVSTARLEEINNQITAKLEANAEDAYLPVLALGGSNNPAAMKMLIQTTDTENMLARACALSGMGTMGAQDQFDYLKEKYEGYADIDRFMALKSIGDIGTPQAFEFLKTAKDDPQNENEYGVIYCVDLYVE